MALNSGQLTELWKSGQLFELGLPGITDSQEQINNVMRMIGFPDTYGDYNNMTASGSTIMAPPDDPSHSSPSSSDPSLSSSQSGLGASGSQVPDNTLLLTFRVERKGNVLNHHYYDFRKTGRTVTPMIIRCRLSNDWFCGQCLSGLGNGPADAGRTCQLCSITNNAVVLHHTQMQVTPMCFVCTGTCYLGHIHHIRPQEETIMVLQYSSQVDVEADRAALYEKEEQQLVQSGHASWARICFMPKRLKPREIMRDHAHYHIGFEIRLGHHHVFSFRNQICMQKDLAPPVTGPGECIDACYPSDSSPPLPLYFPSLLSGWYNKIQCVTSAFYPDLPTANPPPPGSSSSSSSSAPSSSAAGAQTTTKTGTQTAGAVGGTTGAAGGSTGVPAGDPKFKNFPGLVSPALLCTSRGCDTQFSDLFIAPPLVTDREKESKRIQTVEDLCTLSDGLSLSSKKRLLDDIRRRLGVDDPIG